MGMTNVAQVLERAEEFEGILADFYAKVSQQSKREGVRLLADYMSRHRRRTHIALFKLPIESVERIRRICHTPLQYDPLGADCHCLEGVDISEDATASEILDAAIKFDECLVNFYRQVLQQPIDQEVKGLFESLIQWEEYDEIELKKIKAMDYF